MSLAGPFPFPKQEIRHRTLVTGTTAFVEGEFIRRGRLVELHAQAAAAAYRLSPEYLVDGDFEDPKTWDFVAGVADVEGAEIAKTNAERAYPRGWRVAGDRTKVTLNKTAPIHGLRDAKFTLAAVTDILANTSRRALIAGASVLVFDHLESDGGGAFEYAVVRYPTTGVPEWLQGTDTFSTEFWNAVANSATAAKITRAFTAAALPHEVRFRPAAAGLAGFAQIDNVFFGTLAVLADDVPLAVDVHKLVTVQEDSRLSFDAAGAGTVSVVESEI